MLVETARREDKSSCRVHQTAETDRSPGAVTRDRCKLRDPTIGRFPLLLSRRQVDRVDCTPGRRIAWDTLGRKQSIAAHSVWSTGLPSKFRLRRAAGFS